MRLEEVSHILISVVTISIAFTIAFTGSFDVNQEFATRFVTVLLTVGAGFVLHELAHRYVARRYGAWAEYHSWTLGLVLAVAMAFTGFVFAAPGATYVYGPHLSKEANAKIALAGPLTNFVLAFAFLFLGATAPHLSELASTGAQVNFFLGAFNLLPFFVFDGKKVYDWNKGVWLASFLALAAGFFLTPRA